MKEVMLLIALIMMAHSLKAATVKPSVVERACRIYKAIDCNLVKSIVHVETRGNLRTVNILDTNNKYSKGLMMVQELAAREVGLKYGFNQLSSNTMVGLRFGILYLNKKMKQNNNDVNSAAAAYNAGRVIVCKDFNPGYCYPGEFYNESYVWKVRRHYAYLTNRTNKL